jgi:hypothetical protein
MNAKSFAVIEITLRAGAQGVHRRHVVRWKTRERVAGGRRREPGYIRGRGHVHRLQVVRAARAWWGSVQVAFSYDPLLASAWYSTLEPEMWCNVVKE